MSALAGYPALTSAAFSFFPKASLAGLKSAFGNVLPANDSTVTLEPIFS